MPLSPKTTRIQSVISRVKDELERHCFDATWAGVPPVLRIRIRIRMNPHGFGLQDPHPESAVQMRILDADADSD
jgi:hypothetical protein